MRLIPIGEDSGAVRTGFTTYFVEDVDLDDVVSFSPTFERFLSGARGVPELSSSSRDLLKKSLRRLYVE